jgi:FkbM family methyltransferase
MAFSTNIFPLFSAAYTLAVKAKLLEKEWFREVFVSSYFAYKRFYEDPFRTLIMRNPELFRKGDILDIGANIGYTSCLFANALNPNSKIYSFEPDRWNFDLLREVVQRRKLNGTVVPVYAAVGAANGSVELWHNESHHGDNRVATTAFKNGRSDKQISTVPLITIDNFVQSHGLQEISFIKIDVQGYEPAVCEGMKETLARFPDAVVAVEYAPQAMVDLGFEPNSVLDFFADAGYSVYLLTTNEIKPVENPRVLHERARGQGYIDLLCSKSRLSV